MGNRGKSRLKQDSKYIKSLNQNEIRKSRLKRDNKA